MTDLYEIVVRLARNPDAGLPNGDPRRGYRITAPLTPDGALDPDAWSAVREMCTVIRFSPDRDEQADGWLTHRGAQWRFRYDEPEEGPDEPLYRLGSHRFVVGDYVSVNEPDGSALVYRVEQVTPLSTK